MTFILPAPQGKFIDVNKITKTIEKFKKYLIDISFSDTINKMLYKYLNKFYDYSNIIIDSKDIKNINLAKCEALGYGVKLKGKLAIRTTVAINFNGNILGFNMNPSNTHDSKIFNGGSYFVVLHIYIYIHIHIHI